MPYPYQPGDPKFDGAEAYEAYLDEAEELQDMTTVDMEKVGHRVASRMIVEYGEEGAHFLYRSGKLGAAFARFTYEEIRAEMEKKK